MGCNNVLLLLNNIQILLPRKDCEQVDCDSYSFNNYNNNNNNNNRYGRIKRSSSSIEDTYNSSSSEEEEDDKEVEEEESISNDRYVDQNLIRYTKRSDEDYDDDDEDDEENSNIRSKRSSKEISSSGYDILTFDERGNSGVIHTSSIPTEEENPFIIPNQHHHFHHHIEKSTYEDDLPLKNKGIYWMYKPPKFAPKQFESIDIDRTIIWNPSNYPCKEEEYIHCTSFDEYLSKYNNGKDLKIQYLIYLELESRLKIRHSTSRSFEVCLKCGNAKGSCNCKHINLDASNLNRHSLNCKKSQSCSCNQYQKDYQSTEEIQCTECKKPLVLCDCNSHKKKENILNLEEICLDCNKPLTICGCQKELKQVSSLQTKYKDSTRDLNDMCLSCGRPTLFCGCKERGSNSGILNKYTQLCDRCGKSSLFCNCIQRSKMDLDEIVRSDIKDKQFEKCSQCQKPHVFCSCSQKSMAVVKEEEKSDNCEKCGHNLLACSCSKLKTSTCNKCNKKNDRCFHKDKTDVCYKCEKPFYSCSCGNQEIQIQKGVSSLTKQLGERLTCNTCQQSKELCKCKEMCYRCGSIKSECRCQPICGHCGQAVNKCSCQTDSLIDLEERLACNTCQQPEELCKCKEMCYRCGSLKSECKCQPLCGHCGHDVNKCSCQTKTKEYEKILNSLRNGESLMNLDKILEKPDLTKCSVQNEMYTYDYEEFLFKEQLLKLFNNNRENLEIFLKIVENKISLKDLIEIFEKLNFESYSDLLEEFIEYFKNNKCLLDDIEKFLIRLKILSTYKETSQEQNILKKLFTIFKDNEELLEKFLFSLKGKIPLEILYKILENKSIDLFRDIFEEFIEKYKDTKCEIIDIQNLFRTIENFQPNSVPIDKMNLKSYLIRLSSLFGNKFDLFKKLLKLFENNTNNVKILCEILENDEDNIEHYLKGIEYFIEKFYNNNKECSKNDFEYFFDKLKTIQNLVKVFTGKENLLQFLLEIFKDRFELLKLFENKHLLNIYQSDLENLRFKYQSEGKICEKELENLIQKFKSVPAGNWKFNLFLHELNEGEKIKILDFLKLFKNHEIGIIKELLLKIKDIIPLENFLNVFEFKHNMNLYLNSIEIFLNKFRFSSIEEKDLEQFIAEIKNINNLQLLLTRCPELDSYLKDFLIIFQKQFSQIDISNLFDGLEWIDFGSHLIDFLEKVKKQEPYEWKDFLKNINHLKLKKHTWFQVLYNLFDGNDLILKEFLQIVKNKIDPLVLTQIFNQIEFNSIEPIIINFIQKFRDIDCSMMEFEEFINQIKKLKFDNILRYFEPFDKNVLYNILKLFEGKEYLLEDFLCIIKGKINLSLLEKLFLQSPIESIEKIIQEFVLEFKDKIILDNDLEELLKKLGKNPTLENKLLSLFKGKEFLLKEIFSLLKGKVDSKELIELLTKHTCPKKILILENIIQEFIVKFKGKFIANLDILVFMNQLKFLITNQDIFEEIFKIFEKKEHLLENLFKLFNLENMNVVEFLNIFKKFDFNKYEYIIEEFLKKFLSRQTSCTKIECDSFLKRCKNINNNPWADFLQNNKKSLMLINKDNVQLEQWPLEKKRIYSSSSSASSSASSSLSSSSSSWLENYRKHNKFEENSHKAEFSNILKYHI